MFELTSRLLNNLGYIIALAFFFTKFKRAKNIFTKKEYTKTDIILLSIFFSFLSIIGTYTGIYYRGAIVNTRNIGVAVAGIIGGPQVGIITGMVAGIHRFFVDIESPTTIACGISSILGGFITSVFFKKTNEKNCYIYGFISGFLIENLSMLLILLTGFFLYDFVIAIDIVKNIYLPMILANALGVSIVIIIIEDLISEKEIMAGKQAKLALEIANKSLPYIRKGNSLDEVCKIILESLEAKVVVITDDKNIIASHLISDEYILNHSEIKSSATKQVLKTGEFLILGKEESDIIDFQCISGNIKSCIILPLFQEEKKISGTLKLYFDTPKFVTARKQYLAEGLSMLLSTQIELSNIENFKAMAKEAELKALQTQINPHFLFNALHTISSFVRIEPDRAREITRALNDKEFTGFEREYLGVKYYCMRQYDSTIDAPVVYEDKDITNTFGEVLAKAGMKQLRTAETEKYAHVTFFFNGGKEEQFAGEDRKLVASPKVATYDLQPEMSACGVTEGLMEALNSGEYDVIIVNYANPDMVGHTGVFDAAVAAVQKVDRCIAKVSEKVLELGGTLLITADHGNVELMEDPETHIPFTAHTTNNVPFILVSNEYKNAKLEDGKLSDIAPTMLDILGLAKPEEMNGKSLLVK